MSSKKSRYHKVKDEVLRRVPKGERAVELFDELVDLQRDCKASFMVKELPFKNGERKHIVKTGRVLTIDGLEYRLKYVPESLQGVEGEVYVEFNSYQGTGKRRARWYGRLTVVKP